MVLPANSQRIATIRSDRSPQGLHCQPMVKGILDWNVIQLVSMSLPAHFLQSVPEILRDPVMHWWERAGRDGALPGIHAALPGALQAELPRVVASSEFAASALIQDPQALVWVSGHIEPPSARAA